MISMGDMERERDRETETKRETEKQLGREIERQRVRETERERETQRERDTETDKQRDRMNSVPGIVHLLMDGRVLGQVDADRRVARPRRWNRGSAQLILAAANHKRLLLVRV